MFRFDKDILKPEKWAYLKVEPQLEKIDPNEINILRSLPREAESSAPVLENAAQLINDDDYEIYVLKDTNEVITRLNVELDSMVDKRRSLENYSANILPSDINVFFKIDEDDEGEQEKEKKNHND